MLASAPGGIYRIRNLTARICGVLCQWHADDANPDGVHWQGHYQEFFYMISAFPHIHLWYETGRTADCSFGFFPVVWKQSDLGFPTARTCGYTILPERFHLMLKVMHKLTERLLLKVLPLTKLFLFQFGNTWNIIILPVWPIQSFVFMTWKSHCFFICVSLFKVVRKKTVKPEVRQGDWGTSEIAAMYLVLQHEVHWGSGWESPLKGIKKYSKHFVLERLLWFWLSQNCNCFFFFFCEMKTMWKFGAELLCISALKVFGRLF